MQATKILMEEHRVIERVIASLEKAALRLEQDQDVQPEFFIQAADFIKGFADGCHHQKEEGVLFQSMVENGLPLEGGPVSVMMSEHELGRKYTRGMRSAAEAWRDGDAAQHQAVIDHALAYTALLRQHIYKEDKILFPMADRVIPQNLHAEVLEGFEHIEHEETGEGVHEKYLALADSLEAVLN
jgi:hemerythrin-like domain-containing protein